MRTNEYISIPCRLNYICRRFRSSPQPARRAGCWYRMWSYLVGGYVLHWKVRIACHCKDAVGLFFRPYPGDCGSQLPVEFDRVGVFQVVI